MTSRFPSASLLHRIPRQFEAFLVWKLPYYILSAIGMPGKFAISATTALAIIEHNTPAYQTQLTGRAE
jgi:hypothetical protein